MNFLPPPPKKYVTVDDLVIGEKYWIDSGLGGVHTVMYEGKPGAWYNFKNMKDEWPNFSLSPERVPTSIHVCYAKVKDLDEWMRLGGKL
jgi:hypothetical protein